MPRKKVDRSVPVPRADPVQPVRNRKGTIEPRVDGREVLERIYRSQDEYRAMNGLPPVERQSR